MKYAHCFSFCFCLSCYDTIMTGSMWFIYPFFSGLLNRPKQSPAAEVPVKFQSKWESLNPNLAASRFARSRGKTSPYRLVNIGPGAYLCYDITGTNIANTAFTWACSIDVECIFIQQTLWVQSIFNNMVSPYRNLCCMHDCVLYVVNIHDLCLSCLWDVP